MNLTKRTKKGAKKDGKHKSRRNGKSKPSRKRKHNSKRKGGAEREGKIEQLPISWFGPAGHIYIDKYGNEYPATLVNDNGIYYEMKMDNTWKRTYFNGSKWAEPYVENTETPTF
jgi:hypothetical protein